MNSTKDLEPFGDIEPLSDKEVAKFEEKADFEETANAIPASLLPIYELLSDEKKNDFKEQLDNLREKASNYSKLNGDNDLIMACVKEITSIAKTFASKFALPYKPVLEFASSFVTKIQQNEFKTLIVTEWLQLYIEADIEVENSRQQMSANIQETLGDS